MNEKARTKQIAAYIRNKYGKEMLTQKEAADELLVSPHIVKILLDTGALRGQYATDIASYIVEKQKEETE